ncbi:hypothetical protein CGI80_25195 [Vibrio parahaemolyticus]|uniref:hypothetical protein n=1 Tax=Vibrio parahaemolyticus TaxID=670 RepID=UPI001122D105|nr:hypothetical protein [Vibrio parahaemolyticus]TOH44687.1 hypothetical protein CGI80_25195 [Vibrio parahaemolyticus]HCE2133955.1 hypothetical protein [Vibrio parahaemolyticus]
MTFVKFVRTRVQADEPVIGFGDNRFQYSAVFTKIAELNKYSQVEYFIDEENRKIGFKFYDAFDSRDSYSLGGKSNYYRSAAADLIKRYLWVKKVAESENSEDRKFVARKSQGMWVIQLAPAFELTVNRDSCPKALPDDYGIYRYISDDGQIVYIGKGNIKRRFGVPERKDWNFNRIEYSLIPCDAEQFEWEAYWIEKFKENNNGFLPYYNKVSGHSNKS